MPIDISNLKMPAVSGAGLKILEVINSDSVDMNMVGDMVAQDPVLSSTMLSIANSAMYRRDKEITNVRNAIGMLGAKKVQMAVSVVAMRSIEANKTAMQEYLWEHSFGIATLCKLISQYAFPVLVDDIELTGLLHDMGALILSANFPMEYEKLALAAKQRNLPIEAAEQKFFQIDRGELLARMADELHLPDATRKASDMFRSQKSVTSIETDAEIHHAVLLLAHLIDKMLNTGSETPVERTVDSVPHIQSIIGLSNEHIDEINDEYQNVLNSTFAI